MVVVLMGVAGSGKTTVGRLLAGELEWPFYDADDFHPPENVAKIASGVPLTDKDREPWLIALKDLIASVEARGENAVLACSALKQSFREALSEGHEVRFVYLKGSPELIAERLRERKGHFFGPELLGSQWAALEEPSNVTIIEIDQTPVGIVKAIRRFLKL